MFSKHYESTDREMLGLADRSIMSMEHGVQEQTGPFEPIRLQSTNVGDSNWEHHDTFDKSKKSESPKKKLFKLPRKSGLPISKEVQSKIE